MTPEFEKSLLDVIHAELEKGKEADPAVLAAKIRPKLTAAQKGELIEAGLVPLIQRQIHIARNVGVKRPGPSRWEVAAAQMYCVGGEWKMLASFELADWDALAEEYAVRAAQNLAKERECRENRRLQAAAGAATWGEYLEGLEAAA